MSLSNAQENTSLDAIFNASTDPFIQLHNGDPGETCTSNVIAHSRLQCAFGASSGGVVSNTAQLDFTGMPTDTVMAWSAWDASGSGSPPTGGNAKGYGWLSDAKGLMVVRSADLTAEDIQTVAHGLANTERIEFEQVEGMAIPTGLTVGTVYYVISAGLTTDAFRVSTSSGGSAVNLTAVGRALWRRVTPVSGTNPWTFTFGVGQLVASVD